MGACGATGEPKHAAKAMRVELSVPYGSGRVWKRVEGCGRKAMRVERSVASRAAAVSAMKSPTELPKATTVSARIEELMFSATRD